ncbi:unnamed protein product [Periconia digitata]|uniref:Major facilitator superfamily (MFS) profile domain-containing protein n=1 Tax=Periconia digitata TaxID=1303443 RepID=A0A9W4XT04_9PLEO|nr:unnamed protein product [Periconia digitata]
MESTVIDETKREGKISSPDSTLNKDWRFWLVIFSMCLIGFLVALDGSIIGIALPRISNELQLEEQYVWVVNSFWIAQTVFQPLVAQCSNIFGRRTPMILSVAIVAIGSVVAGACSSKDMLIVGRTIQGLGSAGTMLLMEVIVCDIVPLRERGKYLSITLSCCAVGAISGPPIGGAIAEKSWRWIFYMNVPISGVVLAVMIPFMRLKHTPQPWTRALSQIDWIGNIIFVMALTSLLIGLVFGGAVFSWGSWRVVVPIVLGVAGWVAFHIWETSKICKVPVIPRRIVGNRTSLACLVLVFMSSVLTTWINFQWQLYWQAVRGASPLRSGVNSIVYQAFSIPSAAVAGQILSRLGVYRPIHFVSFSILTLGSGLNTILTTTTPTAVWAVLVALNGIGIGIILPTVLPAILSSLAESDVAAASGVYSFARSFGFLWGSTIPTVIFNTSFDRFIGLIHDPPIRDTLRNGRAYQYASGSFLSTLPQPVKAEVIDVFLKSIRVGWQVAIAFAALGLVFVCLERHYPMRKSLESDYGIENEGENKIGGKEGQSGA